MIGKTLYPPGKGVTFIDAFPVEGYTYDGSKAEVDGKLLGVWIDEVNEDDQTDSRISQWVEILKAEI